MELAQGTLCARRFVHSLLCKSKVYLCREHLLTCIMLGLCTHPSTCINVWSFTHILIVTRLVNGHIWIVTRLVNAPPLKKISTLFSYIGPVTRLACLVNVSPHVINSTLLSYTGPVIRLAIYNTCVTSAPSNPP